MTDRMQSFLAFANAGIPPSHRNFVVRPGPTKGSASRYQLRGRNQVVFSAETPNAKPSTKITTSNLLSRTERAHKDTTPSVAFRNYEEVLDPIEVEFTGNVPKYLHNLTLYQIGLGRIHETFSDGLQWRAKHMFEILSMITSVEINTEQNYVRVRSRLNCEHILHVLRSLPKHKYRIPELTKSGRNLLTMMLNWRMPTMDPVTKSALINFIVKAEHIPGRGFVARTDAAFAQEFDGDTLKAGRRFQFKELHPDLTGTGSVSHGVEDVETGEYFNVVWEMMRLNATYQVFRTRPDGKTEILATFRSQPRFLHSFAVTKNYIIIILPPTYFKPRLLALSMSATDSLADLPDKKAKFIVISRSKGGVVATYDHPYFNFMHVANAFERKDDLVVDLICVIPMRSMTLIGFDTILNKSVRSDLNGQLRRFILPSLCQASSPNKTMPASSFNVKNAAFDLTTINPLYQRKPYTYIYGCVNEEGVMNGALLKVNVNTKEENTIKMTNCMLGEPFFVANPDGSEEDDGVLLTMALDTVVKKSYLLVLDAKSLTEVARADLPIQLPLYFHWYSKLARCL